VSPAWRVSTFDTTPCCRVIAAVPAAVAGCYFAFHSAALVATFALVWDRLSSRVVAILLALAAALAVLGATHTHGPGLSPDALSYLGAADSLAHGRGLRVPIADWYEAQSTSRLRHFPPGFSALLALPIALGIGVMDAARGLQALLAGALVWFACALASGVCSPKSRRVAALLAGALVIMTPAWNHGVLLVLSEPLFVALLALEVLVMVYAPERVLLLGSVAASCALVRYAGLAAPLAAAAFVATRHVPLRRRARDLVMVMIPPALAVALWRSWAGDFREFGLFTTGWAKSFAAALATVCDWLAPWPLPAWMRVCCAAIVMLTGVTLTLTELRDERSRPAFTSERRTPVSALVHATTLLSASYIVVLVLSRLCADPDIPFDWRLLSPIIVAASWQMAAIVVRRWCALQRTLRAGLVAYIVLWFGGNLVKSTRDVAELLRSGTGYGSEAWQHAELARWLRGPGKQFELYTNDPAAVWLIARHPARMLPEEADGQLVPAFAKRLRTTPSAIIGLPDSFNPTLEPAALAAQVGFVEVARFENASVWAARDATQRRQTALE
jgi:hypothetical protein